MIKSQCGVNEHVNKWLNNDCVCVVFFSSKALEESICVIGAAAEVNKKHNHLLFPDLVSPPLRSVAAKQGDVRAEMCLLELRAYNFYFLFIQANAYIQVEERNTESLLKPL